MIAVALVAPLAGCQTTDTVRDVTTRARAESCDALCLLAPDVREARIAEVNTLTSRGTYACTCR